MKSSVSIIKSSVCLIRKFLFRVRGFMQHCKERNLFLFCFIWGAILLCLVKVLFVFTGLPISVFTLMDYNNEDNLLLYRDLYTQEKWPGVEQNVYFPGDVPYNVHYVWCGKKIFRFEDYLGVLSIVRILRPQKLIFHYHELPYIDEEWYHTWFQELKQSVPNLVLRHSYHTFHCGSRQSLEFGLEQIAEEGGVFVSERVVLTRVPQEVRSSNFYFRCKLDESGGKVSQGIVFSKTGFPKETIASKVEEFLNPANKNTCFSVEEYNSLTEFNSLAHSSSSDHPCIVIYKSLYPKDVWRSVTKFGELARWLYYGVRAPLQVKLGEKDKDLIPLIIHMVWLKTDNILRSNEFKFLHYLSVMSALHVAGFHQVYIHGEIEPFGQWWDNLKGENVAFIKIEKPETIFQQGVVGPAHQSDVLRLTILLKYGGVYQDRDVIWVNRIPHDLRRYPVVACVDWPRNGEWPEVFNMGVMMAKPGAAWLKHFLKTFSYYRDHDWGFNAIMMPYKAYEQHPDGLYVDRHLQIICFRGICHPAWHSDYSREIDDKRPIINFDWREGRAFHFTVPKPPITLSSPQAIRDGTGMLAEIGKMILDESGKSELMN